MTLGEFITQYCEEHGMSDRAFATLVGISPQQIGNIKRGIGNNGKPMSSTMNTYKKIASAIGMDETDFLNMLNDNVSVNPADDDSNLPARQEMRDEMRILFSAAEDAPASALLEAAALLMRYKEKNE